jgi:hypothetical protein
VTTLVGIALRGCALVFALFVGSIAAQAQDDAQKPEYFYGRFTGGAEIKGDPNAPARRESEVEVAPTSNGFQITWTTLSLDPSNVGGVKVKTAVEKFVRTEHPQLFRSEEDGDPLGGTPLTWASITGNTLTMTTLTVWPDGTHDVASWARRVVDDQMHLLFTRIQDGEIVRRVEGELVRIDDLD